MITDSAIAPDAVQVRRGGTVVWGNEGPSTHHLVDGTGMDLFTLPIDVAGYGTHAFVAAGRYPYACVTHPSLSGTVAVPIAATRVKGSATRIDVTWASAVAPGGFGYDVQVRRPGGRWRLWKDDAAGASGRYLAEAGVGTYRFRARMVRLADGAHARWSVDDAVRVGS